MDFETKVTFAILKGLRIQKSCTQDKITDSTSACGKMTEATGNRQEKKCLGLFIYY